MASLRQAGESRAALTTPNHSPTGPWLFAIVVDGSDPAAGLGEARAMARSATRCACASLRVRLAVTLLARASQSRRAAGGPKKGGSPENASSPGGSKAAPCGAPDSGAVRGTGVCLGLNLVSAVRAPINGLWMVMLAVAVGLAGLA